MRLTTKGRYAVTAMLDLAINHDNESVTLRNIAENQKISLSYLEQLFAKLRKQDLVKGMRGPGGGYRLARNADDISIAEIIAKNNYKVGRPFRSGPNQWFMMKRREKEQRDEAGQGEVAELDRPGEQRLVVLLHHNLQQALGAVRHAFPVVTGAHDGQV